MATAALLKRLNEDVEGISDFLYNWCALYCVFREGREPTRAENVPLIMYFDGQFIVRHAYVDEGNVMFELVDGVGSYEVVKYLDERANFKLPAQSDFDEVFEKTVKEFPLIIKPGDYALGRPVIVGEKNEDSDVKGAGGIEHAPPPSYRLVGLIDSVDPNSKFVVVRVYIRGEHFVSQPYIERVPVIGMDTFESSKESPVRIGAVITTAIKNMDGIGEIVDTSVTVAENGEITVGTVPAASGLSDLYSSLIEPAFASTSGVNYASAINTQLLYTYAELENRTARNLDTAIKELTHRGAGNTKRAALALHKLLFPKTATKPLGQPTKGASAHDKATIENLRQELQTKDVEVAKYESDLRILSLELTDKETQILQLRKDVDIARTATGDKQIAVLAKANTGLQKRLDKAEKAIDRLKGENSGLSTENNQLRRQVTQVDNLQRDVSVLENKRDNLKRDLRARDAQIDRLTSELNAARAGKPPPFEPVKPAKKSTRRAESPKVRDLSDEIGRLASQIVALKAHIRHNPDDYHAKAQLNDKQRVLEGKSSRLFELMRLSRH